MVSSLRSEFPHHVFNQFRMPVVLVQDAERLTTIIHDVATRIQTQIVPCGSADVNHPPIPELSNQPVRDIQGTEKVVVDRLVKTGARIISREAIGHLIQVAENLRSFTDCHAGTDDEMFSQHLEDAFTVNFLDPSPIMDFGFQTESRSLLKYFQRLEGRTTERILLKHNIPHIGDDNFFVVRMFSQEVSVEEIPRCLAMPQFRHDRIAQRPASRNGPIHEKGCMFPKPKPFKLVNAKMDLSHAEIVQEHFGFVWQFRYEKDHIAFVAGQSQRL